MNNNYHTQLNKQNNILNEVAANNQLLQNTLSSLNSQGGYHGVTINKNLPSGYQMNQQTPYQIPYFQRGHVATQTTTSQNQDQDELELSETNIEHNRTSDQNMVDDSRYTGEQKTSQNVVGRKVSTNETMNQDDKMVTKIEQRNPIFSGRYFPEGTVQFKPNKSMSKKEGSTSEYVTMSIVLVVTFIVLVHPRTSKILERYLPKIDSMKGCLIRGVILVTIYIVARFFLDSTGKK
ncbi:MAG: hypothetical protein QXW79_00635 [Thermoplasmata archaeon]